MADDRPNVLLIMSDEHDAAVTGCYGDPLVRTPHLDSLAANGVTFDAHYCNSPLCVPSRLSFTAGQYVSRCGAWGNTRELPSDDYPSLPQALRQAGVTPYLCGKQHYSWNRRYGFEDLEPRFNQNKKNGRGAHRDPLDESVNLGSWTGRAKDIHPGDTSWIMTHDTAVTNRAIQFLDERQAEDGPFFLFVGHLAPHFPLIAPQEIYDYYRDKVPMPLLPPGLLEGQPLNYQHLRRGFGVTDVDPAMVKLARELYWALTDWYDRQIGELLAALKRSAVGDNTVVIYTSDHGENKGDHGLWWKNNCYDHGARVPLIVADPRRSGGAQRVTTPTSHVDLVTTVARLQGATPLPGWDGDSMLGLLDDPTSEWKDTALCQYYGHNIMSGMTMYRQGQWKYIYHAQIEGYGGERELYDMQADPQELQNLAALSEHAERIAAMHHAMVAELGETPETIEARCRADYATGYSD